MISITRSEALSVARRLMRGFAGAPDSRRHAQQFYGALVHAEGWSKADQGLILALGAWLAERPSVHELKKRCKATLETLV